MHKTQLHYKLKKTVVYKRIYKKPITWEAGTDVHEDVMRGFLLCPSSSILPHLSYGLVRSKREYYHNCSLVVFLCSFL